MIQILALASLEPVIFYSTIDYQITDVKTKLLYEFSLEHYITKNLFQNKYTLENFLCLLRETIEC